MPFSPFSCACQVFCPSNKKQAITILVSPSVITSLAVLLPSFPKRILMITLDKLDNPG